MFKSKMRNGSRFAHENTMKDPPVGSFSLVTDYPELRYHDGVRRGGQQIHLAGDVWKNMMVQNGLGDLCDTDEEVVPETSTADLASKGPGWTLLTSVTVLNVHRRGWRGVYDALRAAITRDPRLSFPQEVTQEVWVNVNASSEIMQVAAVQSGTQDPIVARFYIDGLELRQGESNK